SPALERVLGYPPDVLTGTSMFDLVHPEDISRVAATFASCATDAAGQAVLDFRCRHQDGTWCYLEAISTNLLDHPTIAGMVINARDVTERKAFENQLARQAFFDPLT